MINYQETFKNCIENKNKPSSNSLVEALILAEKNNHKNKIKYEFKQLIGTWRLYFITGIKSSRQKFPNLIGSGFYLPSFIKITITYKQNHGTSDNNNQGTIENKVQVGLVNLSVTGPTKYIEKKNILAFDFTHLTMSILGVKIYATDIRGGQKSHDQFYQDSVKKQAFFSYFYVDNNLIIARGREGGLALWKKESS